MNRHYIQESVIRGASLVCLPEYFAYMNHPAIPDSWNEPIWGPIIHKYRKLAFENAVWLSLGGFQETVSNHLHGDDNFNYGYTDMTERELLANEIRRELGESIVSD